ncbi:MAG TPA: FAD-dependent oxidoreductase [Cryptosporangiaceae bacterium]|nr:FAD-dependent oxidoreductase [Cryptosporangiaceae bacterium]
MSTSTLPVAIIGAGPVGLAAAAQLATREIPFTLYEAGPQVGDAIRQWGHVRVFSPWKYNINGTARVMLDAAGWDAPRPERYPTGDTIVDEYLLPLASLPAIAPHIRLGHRVTAAARERADLMRTAGRTRQPFVLRVATAGGTIEERHGAIIDASGTWLSPNPIGANGLPAMGEAELAGRITTGIPNVLGDRRGHFAGRRVLVVGSGHSAFNVLQDLAALREREPATTVEWAIRRPTSTHIFGGGANDALPERGALGQRVARMLEHETIRLHTNARITRLEETPGGIVAHSGADTLPAVDEIIVTTGFRPDLSILRELRLDLDPAVEAPSALAPLIDPNIHSCGSVPPHGYEELQHPDLNVYVVGMKSYGRAPTFLMMTGYEQVRSIAAALAGDMESARKVRLVLPETGVCSTDRIGHPDWEGTDIAASACCGPAPAETLAEDDAACATRCPLCSSSRAAALTACQMSRAASGSRSTSMVKSNHDT